MLVTDLPATQQPESSSPSCHRSSVSSRTTCECPALPVVTILETNPPTADAAGESGGECYQMIAIAVSKDHARHSETGAVVGGRDLHGDAPSGAPGRP
jgi:hypothetical protein